MLHNAQCLCTCNRNNPLLLQCTPFSRSEVSNFFSLTPPTPLTPSLPLPSPPPFPSYRKLYDEMEHRNPELFALIGDDVHARHPHWLQHARRNADKRIGHSDFHRTVAYLGGFQRGGMDVVDEMIWNRG